MSSAASISARLRKGGLAKASGFSKKRRAGAWLINGYRVSKWIERPEAKPTDELEVGARIYCTITDRGERKLFFARVMQVLAEFKPVLVVLEDNPNRVEVRW